MAGGNRGPWKGEIHLTPEEIYAWRERQKREESRRSVWSAIMVGTVVGFITNAPSWLTWLWEWLRRHVH